VSKAMHIFDNCRSAWRISTRFYDCMSKWFI